MIAAGSSAMAGDFDPKSEQCFIMYATSTAPAGTEVSLKNAAGSVLVSEAIPCSFSSVVISTPELQMGERCTVSVGGTEDELVVDNSSSGGFAMTGMFGGGGGGRPFGGQGDMENMPDAPALGDMNGGPGAQNEGDLQRGPGGREDISAQAQPPHGQPGHNETDGGPFTQWGQGRNEPQSPADHESSAISPEALALVGVSVLFLLIGILIAIKLKH